MPLTNPRAPLFLPSSKGRVTSPANPMEKRGMGEGMRWYVRRDVRRGGGEGERGGMFFRYVRERV